MTLQELKKQFKEDPISLVGSDNLFYALGVNCGEDITLQGDFHRLKDVPMEIVNVLKFVPEQKWVCGRYTDEELSIEFIFTT